MQSLLLDRVSGLCLAGFGLLLLLVIIPAQVETVDYGWLRPQMVPNAMAWVIMLGGALQALRPAGGVGFRFRESARAGIYLALVVAGVVAIDRFGFVIAAPLLALALMLAIGERRLLWLFIGVALLPASIWLIVAVVLQRPFT